MASPTKFKTERIGKRFKSTITHTGFDLSVSATGSTQSKSLDNLIKKVEHPSRILTAKVFTKVLKKQLSKPKKFIICQCCQ